MQKSQNRRTHTSSAQLKGNGTLTTARVGTPTAVIARSTPLQHVRDEGHDAKTPSLRIFVLAVTLPF